MRVNLCDLEVVANDSTVGSSVRHVETKCHGNGLKYGVIFHMGKVVAGGCSGKLYLRVRLSVMVKAQAQIDK